MSKRAPHAHADACTPHTLRYVHATTPARPRAAALTAAHTGALHSPRFFRCCLEKDTSFGALRALRAKARTAPTRVVAPVAWL